MADATNVTPMISADAFEEGTVKVNGDSFEIMNGVLRKTEIYSLKEAPRQDSNLVLYQKHDVLNGIDLSQLMFQLTLCVDLYNIVYNATNGIAGLAGNVTALRLSFGETLKESDLAAFSFKSKTGAVVRSLFEAYCYLLEGETEVAFISIGEVSGYAAEMKRKSGEIKVLFEQLRKKTSTTLTSVSEKNAEFYEKMKELQDQESAMKASLGAYQILAEGYRKKNLELQNEIDETKADIKSQETREFALALAAMFAEAASDAAKAFSPGGGTAAGKNTGAAQTGKQTDADTQTAGTTKATEIEEKYKAENEQLKTLQKQKKTCEDKLGLISAAINDDAKKGSLTADIKKLDADDSKDYSAMTLEELQKEQNALKEEISKDDGEIKKLSNSTDVYRKSLEALGRTFDSLSGDLKEIAGKAGEKSESLRSDLKRLREQKYTYDSLYITNLSKVQEMTEKIKGNLDGKKDVAVAIDALILAVGALDNIIAFLQTIELFWGKIEENCTTLNANNEKMLAKARVMKSFKSPSFTYSYFFSLANWVALNSVFTEYLEACDKAHAAFTDTLRETEMGRESHWAKAKTLAADLSKKLGREIAVAAESAKIAK